MQTPSHTTAHKRRQPFPVDAHVHFHTEFDERVFLDAASANFAALADGASSGALLLTESAGQDWFGSLANRTGEELDGGWHVLPSDEPISRELARSDGRSLLVVRGRQVVTCEDLEVLALACAATPDDGGSLSETVRATREAGGLPVVPWGFGKWWAGRGRMVAELLEREPPDRLFLGDNGGRPRASWRPRLLVEAETRGFRVLPGSDPLPFRDQATRAGSCGLLLDSALDGGSPAAALRSRLLDPRYMPEVFGQRAGLLEFVRCQIAMQAKKRLSRRQR